MPRFTFRVGVSDTVERFEQDFEDKIDVLEPEKTWTAEQAAHLHASHIAANGFWVGCRYYPPRRVKFVDVIEQKVSQVNGKR